MNLSWPNDRTDTIYRPYTASSMQEMKIQSLSMFPKSVALIYMNMITMFATSQYVY
jgi:hypothetical protein